MDSSLFIHATLHTAVNASCSCGEYTMENGVGAFPTLSTMVHIAYQASTQIVSDKLNSKQH